MAFVNRTRFFDGQRSSRQVANIRTVTAMIWRLRLIRTVGIWSAPMSTRPREEFPRRANYGCSPRGAKHGGQIPLASGQRCQYFWPTTHAIDQPNPCNHERPSGAPAILILICLRISHAGIFALLCRHGLRGYLKPPFVRCPAVDRDIPLSGTPGAGSAGEHMEEYSEQGRDRTHHPRRGRNAHGRDAPSILDSGDAR